MLRGKINPNERPTRGPHYIALEQELVTTAWISNWLIRWRELDTQGGEVSARHRRGSRRGDATAGTELEADVKHGSARRGPGMVAWPTSRVEVGISVLLRSQMLSLAL